MNRAMYAVQQSLREFLTEAGAGVVDRSTQSLREVRRELSAARRREEGSGAEWAIVSHVSRFAHRSEYSPPTGLFKSAEELQDEPGECTHYGEIEVDLRSHRGHLRLVVRDNGCGIPADVLRRVFDPFYTTKDVGIGTGLGLYICHQIVESHGGAIDVKSAPGRGTTVTVDLPTASGREHRFERPAAGSPPTRKQPQV